MNTIRPLIILSAEKKEVLPEINKRSTENLRGCLHDLGLSFENATGIYNGREEASFVVAINNKEEENAVIDLAFKSFDQECVLIVNKNNEAFLLGSDLKGRTYQGVLTKLDKDQVILPNQNATIVNGDAYITKYRTV
jgi:hypothetical protein